MLITIDETINLAPLARIGRRMKGRAQAINLGADIFLANEEGLYLGRICHYRECRARLGCHALHCGAKPHLNDDLQVVTLSSRVIRVPPIELWPQVTARGITPADIELVLLTKLDSDAAADGTG